MVLSYFLCYPSLKKVQNYMSSFADFASPWKSRLSIDKKGIFISHLTMKLTTNQCEKDVNPSRKRDLYITEKWNNDKFKKTYKNFISLIVFYIKIELYHLRMKKFRIIAVYRNNTEETYIYNYRKKESVAIIFVSYSRLHQNFSCVA